jgi:hypothetical protein
MNKGQLNEWGYPYPIHTESDYSNPPEGDFGIWVGLILVFSVMSLGVLKLGGMCPAYYCPQGSQYNSQYNSQYSTQIAQKRSISEFSTSGDPPCSGGCR